MSTEMEKLLSPEEAKEKAAKAMAKVAKVVVEKKNEGKGGKPVQARVKDKAVAKTEKELDKQKLKEEKENIKKLPKEQQKRAKAELKLKEANKKLEEAKAKNDAKAIEKAKKAVEKAKENLEKIKKKEKLNLKEAAKREKQVQADLDKAGVKKKEAPNKDKDDKSKGKENEHTKSDQKAKLASKINVDGMNIQQHADKYVLVAKNGREIDVTDVMNQIEKYNKGVDAQNAAAKAEGEVKSGIDGKAKDMNAKDAGLPTNGANGNVIVKGTPELVPNIPAPQQQAAEDIVGKNMPNLDKDEKALVAETALQLSKTDLMKDPKGLEKLNERKKENDEKERQREQIKLRQQQNAGR